MMLQTTDLLQIDTRQGTDNQATYSNGNCLPYTGVPFGMNHFVVQTADTRGSWFFNPNDRTFQGIRLSHQPSPWMGDFSQLLLSPVAGSHCQPELGMAQSSYRTDEAVFAPHYIKLKQERYRIVTELTPTTYGAVMRNQYHTAHPKLVLRTPGEGIIKIDVATHSVSGYVINAAGCEDKQMKMFFAMHFSEAFAIEHCGYFDGAEFISSQQVQRSDAVFVIAFQDTTMITTHLATSFLSPEQAQLNLSRILSDDFDETKMKSATKWLNYLNKIEIESKDKQQVATFYGCMYRTCLFPQKMYELNANEEPEHYNTLTKSVETGYLYTNNGFWDTYKTVYPLFSLIAQTEYAEMLSAYLQSYREAGYLPKWLSPDERGMMPGTLIDAVVADAAVKQIGLELMPAFLEAMIHGATTRSDKQNYGRRGTLDYLKLGYVPAHYGESINHTLDYAYSDFCIAQVANILGDDKLAQTYQRQANNFFKRV
ncbi:glycoside hydrolase domain-containing protein [Brochothrix campestris]